MSEIRLFSITDNKAKETHACSFKLEREIQNLFESNLEELLGVKFVASEFKTSQGGRIDTLGIDENGFPVVIEYKLDKNKTVINQGMSYMAWLRSHKAEFWKLVFTKLGQKEADRIDHSSTRLICIATDFSRDDLGAYELMPSSIDLIRYRRYESGGLLLEKIGPSTDSIAPVSTPGPKAGTGSDKPVTQILAEASPHIRNLVDKIRLALLDQGEDVIEKTTQLYLAYKRTRNFASVVVQVNDVLLQLHLDPTGMKLKENMRDVRGIGIWGTGSLQIRIKNEEQIAEARDLIRQAYEAQS